MNNFLDIKIYRLCTNKILFSFGEQIGDSPILGDSLRHCQNQIVLKNNCEIIDIDDERNIKDEHYIIFDEDVFFTDSFFCSVLRNVQENISRSSRFCLEENTFNQSFVFDHSSDKEERLKFNFYYKNIKNETINNVILKQSPRDHFIKVPRQIEKSGQLYYGQCELFAVTIISPFHLLYANLALNLGRTIPIQKRIPEWIQKRFFPIGSKLYYRSLKSMNKIGKNCKIHPSAIIEGCVIGDNVRIGANCVVRLSTIGNDSTLEENITLTYSILGQECYVASGNIVNLCMCYEKVFLIHGPYQFSLFGRSVGVMAVINCDFRLDQQSIRVMTSEGLIDSQQSLLGICYGHESVVGGGNIIAPGRIVPNNIKIAPPSEIIISKFDQ